MRWLGARPRPEIGAWGTDVSDLPTVAFFPVFDEYGYRMVPDMRLLVPIAPVFIITKDPYVVPISGAEFEVTQ